MNRSAAALVFFVGLLGCDLTVHANKKCDWSNCQGCCAADGSCESGNLAQACGMSGATCSNCGERGSVCLQGSCGLTGSGGGATGGGGGATAGGAGGGTAAGSGGGATGGGRSAWAQEAYLKASNTGAGDSFGYSVALSTDGSTLVVGATGEGSNATGVNGSQSNNSTLLSGAVYVFRHSGSAWVQEAYLKASNTGYEDLFGASVNLSADGSTLVVGATGEGSNATGVNGNQGDDSEPESGAVYVFRRAANTWVQEAYLKASNAGGGAIFGSSAALSADGSILAVGAYRESSNARGVNGNQGNSSARSSGAVYVFRRTTNTWVQEAYLKASNTEAHDYFGHSVALSADGSALAVGAVGEDSNATGVNGNQADNSALFSGAVYLFRRTASTWAQEAYLKASNTEPGDYFGHSVALSAGGSTVAVGASEKNGGAVYVFRRMASAWAQEAYLVASNSEADDFFGNSVKLSADGSALAVGAAAEDSNATGVNGNQADNSVIGAVYLFRSSAGVWAQDVYLKASNTGAGDFFGSSMALSANGSTLVVGAFEEDSNAIGVNGNQADNSALRSGAVYGIRSANTV